MVWPTYFGKQWIKNVDFFRCLRHGGMQDMFVQPFCEELLLWISYYEQTYHIGVFHKLIYILWMMPIFKEITMSVICQKKTFLSKFTYTYQLFFLVLRSVSIKLSGAPLAQYPSCSMWKGKTTWHNHDRVSRKICCKVKQMIWLRHCNLHFHLTFNYLQADTHTYTHTHTRTHARTMSNVIHSKHTHTHVHINSITKISIHAPTINTTSNDDTYLHLDEGWREVPVQHDCSVLPQPHEKSRRQVTVLVELQLSLLRPSINHDELYQWKLLN